MTRTSKRAGQDPGKPSQLMPSQLCAHYSVVGTWAPQILCSKALRQRHYHLHVRRIQRGWAPQAAGPAVSTIRYKRASSQWQGSRYICVSTICPHPTKYCVSCYQTAALPCLGSRHTKLKSPPKISLNLEQTTLNDKRGSFCENLQKLRWWERHQGWI